MADRTSRNSAAVTWSDRQIRQHAAGAFRYAVATAGATQVDAAKWMRRSERTVRDWLAGRAPVDTNGVLRSGRLRGHFLRYLTVCHGRVRKTFPLILRARKARH